MKTHQQCSDSSFLNVAALPAWLICAASLLLNAVEMRAQVPQLIHYQGRVAVNGVNFDGNGQFKFALVGTNSSGATVTYWSNNGSSAAGAEPSVAVVLPVSRGLYSLLLGDVSIPNMTPLPATVFQASTVWLRVWFNDGTRGSQRITPDQRIAAVGYAMMAAAVPDGAITSAKLAPDSVVGAIADNSLPIGKLVGGSIGGQLLSTDANGVLKWESASTIAALQGQPSMLVPDPDNNRVDVEILGVMTNRVIVVSGPGMELEEIRLFDEAKGARGLMPRTLSAMPFAFEFSGTGVDRLLAELNTSRTNASVTSRKITLAIRDAANIVRVRWTLSEMELTRIDPGFAGRMRYTFECTGAPARASGQTFYTRNPTNFPAQVSVPTGSQFYELEIDGVNQGGYPEIQLDTREQTLTLTFEYAEGGDILAWWMQANHDASQGFVNNRNLSVIRQELVGTQRREILRINYYDVYPIRYQQIGGFGQREKLKERIVLRYRLREKA